MSPRKETTCTQCGATMRPNAKFCRTCGAATPVIVGEATVGPVPEGVAGVVTCPRCDHSNPADSRFCRSCGTTLPARTTSMSEADPPTQRLTPSTAEQYPPPAPPSVPAANLIESPKNGLPTAAVIAIVVLVIAGGAGAVVAIIAARNTAHAVNRAADQLHTVITENEAETAPAAPSEPTDTTEENSSSSESSASGSTTSESTPEGEGAGTPSTGNVKGGAASVTSSHGPSTTIREHLNDLENGDYQGAFELMSAKYRGENPSWPSVRGAADPTIHIVTVGSPDYHSGAAHIYVDFYAQDAHPTTGSDTYCREFTGTVELISQGGAWRYNPYGNNLHSKLQPNSDCQS